jgi:hypothetical protein
LRLIWRRDTPSIVTVKGVLPGTCRTGTPVSSAAARSAAARGESRSAVPLRNLLVGNANDPHLLFHGHRYFL